MVLVVEVCQGGSGVGVEIPVEFEGDQLHCLGIEGMCVEHRRWKERWS